ncbi:unnamed protein product [Closterium sp. NIES-53]
MADVDHDGSHDDEPSKNLPPQGEEMKLYTEASAFEGAAIVAMIQRLDEEAGTEQKILQITMEDGITLSVELDPAEKRLNELGYRQELRRSLRFLGLYAVGVSFMTVFAGFVPTYAQGFINGGPAGLVWYWWITALFVHLIGLSMAEIASSFPTAGSLYFWAAALAGPKWGPLASFITGWMEFLGLAVCGANVSYGGSVILQVLILISTGGADGGGYLLSKYAVFAIACGFVLICFLINCLSVRTVATVMVISAAIQIVAAVVLIIMLPLVAPTHEPASWVFGDFGNNREITLTPSNTYSFLITLLVSQYSLYGYDCVAHLTEETKNADRTAPLAIMSSLTTVTVLAWVLVVVLTWSIQDPAHLFAAESVTGGMQPVVQIMWDVFYTRYGSGLGAQVFTVVICISFFGATLSCQLGASRVLCVCYSKHGGARNWTSCVPSLLHRPHSSPPKTTPQAYALSLASQPFSSLWRHLTPNRMPVWSLSLSVLVGLLFLLPVLASSTLFIALASISTITWIHPLSFPPGHPPTPYSPTPQLPQACALARDGGLPFSSLWRRLATNRVPVWALTISVLVGLLFLLPLLASSTLFMCPS